MSTVDEGALGRGESGWGERPGCTVSSGVLSGGETGQQVEQTLWATPLGWGSCVGAFLPQQALGVLRGGCGTLRWVAGLLSS